MISKRFKEALKLDPRPQYKIAWEAGVNPTTLSQFVTGYARPSQGDERVLRIGVLLGLKPRECFEPSELSPESVGKRGTQYEKNQD